MPRGATAKERRGGAKKSNKKISEAGPANLVKEGTKRDSFGSSMNSFLRGVKTNEPGRGKEL